MLKNNLVTRFNLQKKDFIVVGVSFSLIFIVVLVIILANSQWLFSTFTDAQSGRHFYVSQSGSDSNSGTTADKPFKTIGKVNSLTLIAGDTISFERGGVWNDTSLKIFSSGTKEKYITIDSYGNGALPVIDLRRELPKSVVWKNESANIWYAEGNYYNILFFNGSRIRKQTSKSQLDLQNEYYRDDSVSSGKMYIFSTIDPNTSTFIYGTNGYGIDLKGSKSVKIKDIEVIGAQYSSIRIQNTGSGDAEDGNIILQGVTLSNSFYSNLDIKDSSYNTIEDVTSYDAGAYGISIKSSNTNKIVQNNTINKSTAYGNLNGGLLVQGYNSDTRVKNNIISNNTSYDNGDGLYLRYADNNEVFGNNFYNNKLRDRTEGEGYGIGVQSGSNNNIYNNVLRDNRTRGIEIWGGAALPYGPSNSNTVTRNRIYENDNIGVFLSAIYVNDTTISYNLIYKNGDKGLAISNSGTQRTKILNNTFYANASDAIGSTSKDTIINNLFINSGRVNISPSSTFQNNGLFNTSVRLSSTQNYSGADIEKQLSTNIYADPKFANAENGDFSLASNSVYLDKGSNVELTTDFNGNQIQNAPDIGALEYSAVIITSTPIITVTSSPTQTATLTPTPSPTIVGDSKAPTITAYAPLSNKVLGSEDLVIAVSALDESGINRIELLVGNQVVRTCYGVNSCVETISNTFVPNGKTIITVKAYDNSSKGNISTLQITVTK